jgi:predicted nucleotidyltransferase
MAVRDVIHNRPVLNMDREKLIEKVAEVLAGFPQVVLAYLFGSFLRGEKFNDLDLGLVSLPAL